MKRRQIVDRLSKFLDYVLGRQPDEFGLVADDQGWVRLKDLLKALSEEPGWRHVRLNGIREINLSGGSPSVEIDADRIRAADRSNLFKPRIPENPPKLLFHAVRRRAYPVILEKGVLVRPGQPDRLVLSGERSMAERIGRRIDPDPVILTVNAASLFNSNTPLWRYGQQLYLTTGLPPGTFSGPPLPKKSLQPNNAPSPPTPEKPKTPGSYIVDLSTEPGPVRRPDRQDRKRKNAWKRDRKRMNRTDGNRWSEE